MSLSLFDIYIVQGVNKLFILTYFREKIPNCKKSQRGKLTDIMCWCRSPSFVLEMSFFLCRIFRVLYWKEREGGRPFLAIKERVSNP